MIVEPQHDGTYWATSADDADHYTIATGKDCNGIMCLCPDWDHRCAKVRARGVKLRHYHMSNRNMCKHSTNLLIYIGQCVIAKHCGVERTELFEDHV